MTFRETVQKLFGSSSADDSSAEERHAETPSGAGAVPRDEPSRSSAPPALRDDDAGVAPDANNSAADAFRVAHGQELLGPCRLCGGHWTRELTRGKKPVTCPVCKRLGPPASTE